MFVVAVAGALKMQDVKLQDMKMTDKQATGLENYKKALISRR